MNTKFLLIVLIACLVLISACAEQYDISIRTNQTNQTSPTGDDDVGNDDIGDDDSGDDDNDDIGNDDIGNDDTGNDDAGDNDDDAGTDGGSGGSSNPCTPVCTGLECGDDGCSGSCGTCDDSNECTTDACAGGACVYTNVTNGTACTGGVCSAGSCVECILDSECDDSIDCTVDTCTDNTCVNIPDDNLCGANEVCIAGAGCVYVDPGQPVILSVSGTIVDGENFTINGSGFGTKDPVEPYLWDTIDNQEAYSGLSHGDVIPAGDGYPWSANGAYNYEDSVKYWTIDPRVPGKPHYHVPANMTGYLNGRDLGDETPTKFYVNWWTRFSGNINNGAGGGSSTKIIRVWVRNQISYGTISWTGMHTQWSQFDDGNVSNPVHWGDWDNGADNFNTWHNVDIAVDSNGWDTNEASFICRTNGEIIHNVTTLGGTGPFNTLTYIGLGANHPENLDNITADFTDIYVDGTFARIVLGDAPNYENITYSEMQIPHTTWNDSTIEFTANLGSFEGEQLYLFVINEDGIVSNGFAI
ncbi:hypothetical protein ACFLQN_04020 [Candidatus Aenigmatarchaeota archaeon]